VVVWGGGRGWGVYNGGDTIAGAVQLNTCGWMADTQGGSSLLRAGFPDLNVIGVPSGAVPMTMISCRSQHNTQKQQGAQHCYMRPKLLR
jgi:hypothetical protein